MEINTLPSDRFGWKIMAEIYGWNLFKVSRYVNRNLQPYRYMYKVKW